MSPKQAKPKSEAESKRKATASTVAARRRRSTAQRSAMNTKTNRVASELERYQERADDLRSRAERVAERVKRLV
jgi:hypothetical protein